MVRLIVFLLSIPSLASASVWHYQYVNTSPIDCRYATPGYCDTAGPSSNYQFSIDEALYPGGSIANSTLTLIVEDIGITIDRYTVQTPRATYSGQTMRSGPRAFEWLNWFSYDTTFSTGGTELGVDHIFRGNVGESFLSLSFGKDGDVVSWSFSVQTGGGADYNGSTDSVGVLGDGDHSINTTWQVTRAPAPVPLPAGFGLLLAGLLSLSWKAWRRTGSAQSTLMERKAI